MPAPTNKEVMMDSMLPSQPENYRALIKRSLLLYSKSFIKVLPFALLLAITVFIPRFLESFAGMQLLPTQTFGWEILWLILIDIAGILFFIAILWHIHCVIINKHEPLIEDIVVGLKKAILVFIAVTIQSLIYTATVITMFGMQLFVGQYKEWILASSSGMFFVWLLLTAQMFVIIYVATLFVFLTPIIAIENKGVFSALKRSVLLVWNHWWRTVCVLVTPWLSYFLTLVAIRYVFGANISIYFVASGSGEAWIILLQLCLFAIYIPWVASLLLVQLKDLELRNKMVLTDE